MEATESLLSWAVDETGIHVHRMDDHFVPARVFDDARPDMESESESESDLASVGWAHHRMHRGEVMAGSAPGGVAAATGRQNHRVRDRKVVESWATMDVARIMAHLAVEAWAGARHRGEPTWYAVIDD